MNDETIFYKGLLNGLTSRVEALATRVDQVHDHSHESARLCDDRARGMAKLLGRIERLEETIGKHFPDEPVREPQYEIHPACKKPWKFHHESVDINTGARHLHCPEESLPMPLHAPWCRIHQPKHLGHGFCDCLPVVKPSMLVGEVVFLQDGTTRRMVDAGKYDANIDAAYKNGLSAGRVTALNQCLLFMDFSPALGGAPTLASARAQVKAMLDEL